MALPIKSKTSAQSSSTRTASARGTVSSKSGFQYKPRTAEELREQAQQRSSRDSFFPPGIQFFTPKVGDNILRILPPPPEKGDDWRSFGFRLHVHYGIGPDEAAYLCLDKMKGEKCPICEERTVAKNAGQEDLVDALRIVDRIAVYVIDRSQEGKGPLIWNMPSGVNSDICGRSVDKRSGKVYNVDDPEEGYDVTFTREGQGQITKYKAIEISRDQTPLSEDPGTTEDWLKHVVENPLDEILVYYDYDHIKSALGVSDGGGAVVRTQEKESKSGKNAGGTKTSNRQTASSTKKEEKKADANPELPTYEQLLELDDDAIAGLAEENKIEFPDDPFDDRESLCNWMAEQLGIEVPGAAAEEDPPVDPEPAKKSSWRDKLKQTTKK